MQRGAHFSAIRGRTSCNELSRRALCTRCETFGPSDDSHKHAEGRTATNKAKTELKTEKAPRRISQDVLLLAVSDGVSLSWACSWTRSHRNEHSHLWKFSSRYLFFSRPISFCLIIKNEIDTLRMRRRAWTCVTD